MKLTKISPIHVYINRIINRFVLQIKDGYKLELQNRQKNPKKWRKCAKYKAV